MIQCENPIKTKSGYVVPCGKCPLCLSARRNEWSIRLGLEVKYNDRMPLFITLTYDDEHLPLYIDGEFVRGLSNALPFFSHPTVYRPDVSSFIKAYKRKYKLNNTDFHFFGCMEYGDTFNRPHAHLLFFNDNELQDLFDKDSNLAQERIKSVWNNGHVHICQAGYDGIHYVTKYCLKDSVDELPLEVDLPFTICSKNLGAAFFKSRKAKVIQDHLLRLVEYSDEIYRNIRFLTLDSHDVLYAINYIKQYIPDFTEFLDDGRRVFLPRYFRRKLIGQFEHFKDSPFWFYNHLCQLYDSIRWYEENDGYHGDLWKEKMQRHVDKINQRYLQRVYNNKFKRAKKL